MKGRGFIRRGTLIDPSASSLIGALVAAGASPNTAQISAINAFFLYGKRDGWYSSIKRLYLPVWGAASPNAIDWIARASGSYVGGVTHGSGFVQGNGTSGYFDMTVQPSALGLSNVNQHIGALINQAATTDSRREIIGVQIGSDNCLNLHTASGELRSRMNNLTTSNGQTTATLSVSNAVGILMANYNGVARTISSRKQSGYSVLANVASVTPYGNLPSANIWAMANNFSGGGLFSDARFGSFWVGTSLSDQSQFSARLKTLWESLTGLSLP